MKVVRAVLRGRETITGLPLPDPEHEKRAIPQWAERERTQDLAWIGENLQAFWEVARRGYEASGRGALVVDIGVPPTGAGHPSGYVPEEQIRQLGATNEMRMIAAYNPAWELVIILLKPQDRPT